MDKFQTFLINNQNYPLVVEGIDKNRLSNSVILPASISSKALGVVPGEKGYKVPKWLKELEDKYSVSQKTYLIIEGLDKIDKDEQLKFFGIIKYNGINGYAFKNTQIVVLVEKGETHKINQKILSLSLVYKD